MMFRDLPLQACFFLPDHEDVCRKITPTQAVDSSCARGWCLEVQPETVCDLAVRNFATLSLSQAPAAPSICVMKVALDQRYRTGGRAAREGTMILDVECQATFRSTLKRVGPWMRPRSCRPDRATQSTCVVAPGI